MEATVKSASGARDVTWLTFPILGWGSTFVAVETALPVAPPVVVATLRALGGAVIVMVIASLYGRRLPSRYFRWAAALGFFNTAVVSIGITVGTQRVGPAITAVIVNSSPLLIAAFSLRVLKERIDPWLVGVLVCGFIGVLLIVGDSVASDANTSSEFLIGFAIVLLGSCAFAIGSVITRRIVVRFQDVDLLALTGWQFLFGGLFLLPLTLAQASRVTWTSPRLWLASGYLMAIAVCMWGWFRAIELLGAARAGSFIFMVPVVAVLIEFIRGNIPSLLELIGMSMVILALRVSVVMVGRMSADPSKPELLPP